MYVCNLMYQKAFKIQDFHVISHRSIVVIAEFNDAFGTQMMNFVFDYENKKWFKNGIIQSPNPSTKRFLVSISGQFFYMRIMFHETETYFVSDEKWYITSPILDGTVLKNSTYLSVINTMEIPYYIYKKFK